jgi:hypothetical protein
VPRKSERSGRYKGLPSPPTFTATRIKTTIGQNSLVREMIIQLLQFAHYAKASSSGNSQTPSKHHGKKSTKPCFRWRDTGARREGDNCHFAHGSVAAAATSSQTKSNSQTSAQAKAATTHAKAAGSKT